MTKTISVKELRHNFGTVRQELENGTSFIIIYRSTPICELRPLQKTGDIPRNEIMKNWPVFHTKDKKPFSAAKLIRQDRDEK